MNKIYLYIIGCIVLGGILVCTGCLSTNSSIVHTPSLSPVFPVILQQFLQRRGAFNIQTLKQLIQHPTLKGQCIFVCNLQSRLLQDPKINTSICPSPTLIFNNSQPITQLQPWGFFFLHTVFKCTIPLGGIVYHSQRFTRVFDATGKQIMIINDSESITYSPGRTHIDKLYGRPPRRCDTGR